MPQRDESKLLIYKQGKISEDIYYHLDKYIPPFSLLVFNNTKVVAGKIVVSKIYRKCSRAFLFRTRRSYIADITTAMTQKGKVVWKCLAGGAKKWKEEPMIKLIKTDSGEIKLTAKKLKRKIDYFLVELSWNDDSLSFSEILHIAGAVPLPPYIKSRSEMKLIRNDIKPSMQNMRALLQLQRRDYISQKGFSGSWKRKIFIVILLHCMLVPAHLNP